MYLVVLEGWGKGHSLFLSMDMDDVLKKRIPLSTHRRFCIFRFSTFPADQQLLSCFSSLFGKDATGAFPFFFTADPIRHTFFFLCLFSMGACMGFVGGW